MSDRYHQAAIVLSAAVLAGCAGQLPVNKPVFALDKYIVRPGDTIEAVAYRYGLSSDELRARNNLSGGSALKAGTLLSINGKSSTLPQPAVAAVSHDSRSVVVPNAIVQQPVRQVKTVVMPASARIVEREEIVETVEFEKPTKKISGIKPSIKKSTVSADGWTWPASGAVARGFQPNVVNRQGLDIAAKGGEDIVAAADGTVVYSGQDLASHGKLVILRHENNMLSAYSFAHELYVQEDEIVRAGDAIASLGDTDEQSAILHFEIRKDGKPVNPIKYLPNR